MKWLRRKGGKKLNHQDFFISCKAYGITDTEAYLITKVAECYPYPANKILGVYMLTNKSFDRTLESIENAMGNNKSPIEAAYFVMKPKPKD